MKKPNAFQSFVEAKSDADKKALAFKSPFSVVFDYCWDGLCSWRVSLGNVGFKAAYVAGK